jgi:hypothetical protein
MSDTSGGIRLRDMVKSGGWIKCIHPSDYGLEEGKLYQVVYRGSEKGSPREDRDYTVLFYKVKGIDYEWFYGRFIPAKWYEVFWKKFLDLVLDDNAFVGGRP